MKKDGKEKKKRKLPVWAMILIIIGSVAAAAAIAVIVLAYGLLGRISRPDTGAPEFTDSFIVTPIPRPTYTPVPENTASDAAEETPALPQDGSLPLEDVCPQTHLSPDILGTMDGYNRTNSQFINILLVGADRRGSNGNANADVMMIATIDRKHGSLKLSTVMRDMLVDIPGYGYDKLNSSASKGGYELLINTINANFHLNITQYVMVDFGMFESIVDALDGVTVKMTAAEISAANDCIAGLNKERGVEYLWDGFIFAQAGNVKLTGKQALGFARVRHIDSDFSRTERQFKILNAIYAKFMNMNAAKQYQLLYKLLPMVETNMTDQSILEAGVIALSLKAGGLTYHRIPEDGMYESGKYARKSVLLCDIPASAWALHKFIYESDEPAAQAAVLTPGESLPPRTPTPEWLLPTPTVTPSDIWGD